ncbi:MAG: hypothetical protein ABI334_03735 [Candidatus Dormiibacterota bacterium]
MTLKRCRKRSVIPKSNANSAELAPEIDQVIAVVAEIMLDQRRRRPLEGNSVDRGMIANDSAKNESFEAA